MVVKVKHQEVATQKTASQTRGTPAFCVLETVRETKQRTESGQSSSYFAPGIPFDAIEIPSSNFREDPADRLALLDEFDD
jgi:hypothetical protein